MKLAAHHYSQCHVVKKINGHVKFYSYDTLTAEITTNGWFKCYCTCSQTTRRQLGWFLKEYAPYIDYQQAKRMKENFETFNIKTGELFACKPWEYDSFNPDPLSFAYNT